jgi:hypothetical protein
MELAVLEFLRGDPGYLALFEAVEGAVAQLGESRLAVSKTQISWGNPKKFAFFSLPHRRGPAFPAGSAICTFGLGERVEHPRIAAAVEPYPGRWTHHVVVSRPEEVDGQLREWLAQAYVFAREKGSARSPLLPR